MRFLTGDSNGLCKMVDVDRKTIPCKFGKQEKKHDVSALLWAGVGDTWWEQETQVAVAKKHGVVELWRSSEDVAAHKARIARESKEKIETIIGPQMPKKFKDATFTKVSEVTASDSVVRMFRTGPNNTNLLTVASDGVIEQMPESWLSSDACSSEEALSSKQVMNIRGPVADACWDGTTNKLLAGGKGNLLKLYDLDKETPIWNARGPAHTTLDLQPPVLVKSVQFMEPGSHVALCTTLDGKIQVYDTRASAKSARMCRPVLELPLNKAFPVTSPWAACGSDMVRPVYSSCVVPSRKLFFVGDNVGSIHAFDMRKLPETRHLEAPHGRKDHFKAARLILRHKGGYRGPTASIRSIQAHSDGSTVVAVGLDRFAHVFDISSRKETSKVYLKQHLNCVLFSEEPSNKPKEESEDEEDAEVGAENEEVVKQNDDEDDDDEDEDDDEDVSEDDEDDDDDDLDLDDVQEDDDEGEYETNETETNETETNENGDDDDEDEEEDEDGDDDEEDEEDDETNENDEEDEDEDEDDDEEDETEETETVTIEEDDDEDDDDDDDDEDDDEDDDDDDSTEETEETDETEPAPSPGNKRGRPNGVHPASKKRAKK